MLLPNSQAGKQGKPASLPHFDRAQCRLAFRRRFDESDEKSYRFGKLTTGWLSKTPYERLQAVDLMRRIIHGYDPFFHFAQGQAATRVQSVLEVTQRALNINKKASGRHRDLADLENLP